jgi:thymidylate synthase (FAD)
MKIQTVGEGKVVLLAGGGKVYADTAARFCRSEKSLDELAGAPHDVELVRRIVQSGHEAALEFDWFIFGVEGYSRVCETQLVRKRMASYLIKSGRPDKHGKREFSAALPASLGGRGFMVNIRNEMFITLTASDVCGILSQWYDAGIKDGIPEEDLRYLKPQATEFKGVIGMNAHALRDWFKIRLCNRAQAEIRDMARKMLRLCREAAPELFEGAGPSCEVLGYCPELEQCRQMQGKMPTKAQAMEALKALRKEAVYHD